MITRKSIRQVDDTENLSLMMVKTTIHNSRSPEPLYILTISLIDGEREWPIVDRKGITRFWWYTSKNAEQFLLAGDYFDHVHEQVQQIVDNYRQTLKFGNKICMEEPVQTVTIERAIETYKEYMN